MRNKRRFYKPIFCDSLLEERTTFEQCKDCNYPNLKPYLISIEKKELDCSNKCNKYNNTCKSYSYHSDKSCKLYNRLPNINTINYRAKGTNSGYIKKYKDNYNNLSEDKKNEIKLKCASQYLDKKFVINKNIDLKDCLKVINNKDTELYVDPQCLFNKYNKNNRKPIIKNVDIYKNDNIINKTDQRMNIYDYNYKMYMNTKKETKNKNNNDKIKNINQSVSHDHNYKNNYSNSMNNMFNPIIDSYDRIDKRLGIFEKFNANQMRNVHRSFLIIILFSIFIFFIISFYTIKKK